MRYTRKTACAALFLGAALLLGADQIPVRAAEQQPAVETPAAPPAETPVTPPAEVPVTPPAETPVTPPAETPAAPPAETPITPPAETPVTPPGETPATPPAETPPPAAKPRPKKDPEKEKREAEQLKKDIASCIEKDAKDAILNGYLSLLNQDYILKDELELELVSIGNGHRLEERAARSITALVKAAKKERMNISVTSSYRTYAKQVSLFKNKISRLEGQKHPHAEAVKEAAKVVAVPGTSEHQLGLTVDFVTGSYKKLDEGIRETKEYRWVEEHAWEYGYIIRYPKGKSHITGIITEPWHLRYVGIPAAKLITEQGVCLEEFLGVAYDGQKDGISHGAGWVNTGR